MVKVDTAPPCGYGNEMSLEPDGAGEGGDKSGVVVAIACGFPPICNLVTNEPGMGEDFDAESIRDKGKTIICSIG
jgi:hypothetical protein